MSAPRLFALALLCAAPAAAQPAPSLAGAWTFETTPATARHCVIAGEAVVTATPARGAYDVQLRALETCGDGARWESVQSCRAAQRERAVRIDCTLVQATPSNYAADDFVLELKAPGLMEGVLTSTWDAPARWRRAGADHIS
ncbi:MAG: hypothetical protein HXY28_04445 [Hydrogenophilaceae bacterium]|jgi:hypothetical protein|nr:hypothetical protein [Hydrogenophilaceae bacterium]